MCGLAGLWTTRGLTDEALKTRAAAMAQTLLHRGPDDEGLWTDAAVGIALGFRRLAIIDLSAQGHQPMLSPSGRFTMVFNGEVFNHAELRRELEAHGARFRGHSDTEVMLAAFEEWGIEAAVRRFVGMFGIAVWDGHERALHLIRDRLGIKPIYFAWQRGMLLFGSEIKALRAEPTLCTTLDRDAAAAYLRYLYVPAPASIFREIRKLPPGHLLTVRDAAVPPPSSHPYWSLDEVVARGAADPFQGTEVEAVDALDRLLSEAVRLRMQADVPLGALLSGGIDSSTVVALMQEASTRPILTFSIGFDEARFNEAQHARAVAGHLGTEHTELTLTGADALAVVPRIAGIFDEPFADPSQIPTLLVCELARRRVTVALSGDGGDELFAGYHRYIDGAVLLERLAHVPAGARRVAAAGLAALSPAAWDRLHAAVRPLLPPGMRHRLVGEKVHKVARLLTSDGTAGMYRSLLGAWQEPLGVVPGSRESGDNLNSTLDRRVPPTLLERMMLADQQTYLPDDLLAKLDRVSMAISLEARVPLLDHRVVEFSWRLPVWLKVRGGRGKWLLRQVLHRRIPKGLVDRPKMGFSVPLARWLQGPLREWGEELLSERRLREGGVLAPQPVRAAWQQLRAGQRDLAPALWAALMFQAWQERWQAGQPPALAS